MSASKNNVAERLAAIAGQMEEALLEAHVDRFHELAKQRSRDLRALMDRRRDALSDPGGGREQEVNGLENILTRAVQENQRMLTVAQQRLGIMRKKIDNLLDRKSVHNNLGRRYNKLSGSGHLFSYSG